jgi:hypothetical protein
MWINSYASIYSKRITDLHAPEKRAHGRLRRPQSIRLFKVTLAFSHFLVIFLIYRRKDPSEGEVLLIFLQACSSSGSKIHVLEKEHALSHSEQEKLTDKKL